MKKIVCTGYGNPHRFPAGNNTGRHWFACGRCRWAPSYRGPVADAPKGVPQTHTTVGGRVLAKGG